MDLKGPPVTRIYLIKKDPDRKVLFLGVDCSHCGHENDVEDAEFPDLTVAHAKIAELTKANENLAANLYILRENDNDSWKQIAEKFEDALVEMREERDKAREMWQRYEKDAIHEAHDAAILRTDLKAAIRNPLVMEPIFLEAKRQWGEKSQVIAAAEEFSEAAAVMCRYANSKIKDLKDVITELADAEIMCAQMRHYFDGAAIDAEKEYKLKRLAGRLGLSENVTHD